MREYVSTEELDAYADIYNAAADAEVAKQGGEGANRDLANPPPAPRRETLSLNDLSAAEAARAAGTLAADAEGTKWVNVLNVFVHAPVKVMGYNPLCTSPEL